MVSPIQEDPLVGIKLISLRLPRQLSQLRLSRGFLVLSAIMVLRFNLQGAHRSLWPVVTFRPAKYLPNLVWCFLVLFASISFSDSSCSNCLPSRSCSHDGDAWASSPCFSTLRILLFLGSEPAGHLVSRRQSSIRLLLEDPDQPCQPSLCNGVCKSIDGRRQYQQCSPAIVPPSGEGSDFFWMFFVRFI